MNVVLETLSLYKTVIRDSVTATLRNWVIVPGTIGLWLAFSLLSFLVGGLGLVGGFIMGFAAIAGISMYYSWISRAVDRDKLQFSDLIQFDLIMFNKVMSVAFILWIASFALSFALKSNPWLFRSIAVVASFIFNPTPEILHQVGYEREAALAAAIEFLKENWIEWFFPVALVIGFPFLLMKLSLGFLPFRAVDIVMLLSAEILLPCTALIKGLTVALPVLFAQFLGNAGTLASLPGVIISLAFASWFMIFRAYLFKALAGSSRRQRAFKRKMQVH